MVSRAAKALAIPLVATVEADDEVEADAVLGLDPSADSSSDRLSEPSPLVSSALIRLEARFEAALSKLDVADEDEDEDEAVLELAAAWAEVRLDKVSELKRSEPLLEGIGGGGPGG